MKIISKEQLGKLKVYKTTFNYANKINAISIELKEPVIEPNKLIVNDGFEFIYLKEIDEFMIIPNENLDKIIAYINLIMEKCETESDLVIKLINFRI